ncbi:hypothetical protein H0H92_007263 [Tricholoma furcatifolium]|nr:hypothetical protein H0H92_007263 [Tricholoma furcatifolium]
MASSAHHQHPRYSHLPTQNSRDEDALRLPSIKDLGFRYSRRGPEDVPPLPTSIAPADTSLNREPWSRPVIQPQNQSIPTHLQPQHHQHQQLTPPLSAGHEHPQQKNDYSSKPDGAFMTPGVPLSAQSTPMPGSVTIGPGTRGDDVHQPKRRRSSGGPPREQRSSHPAYPPHYAPYPPSQPPQTPYQMQAPVSHPPPPVQQPIEHVTPQQVAPPPHPGYPTYQPQYPPPGRIQLHSTPQQQPQPPPANPYPPPAPPSHTTWEQQQPHHAQSMHPHQPPPPPQIQPPPPQHAAPIQQPTHPMPQHSQPPLPPQHHQLHPQPHQPQQTIVPPLPHHAQSQQQPHQPPPQMQQPQISYGRTTAIVPIDTRSHYPVTDDRMPPPSVRDSTMTEMQQTMPEVCPGPDELQEMSQRAAEVVRLLEELRRMGLPESERVKIDNAVTMTPPEDHRPPKRPWEDMSQEDPGAALVDSTSFVEQQYPTPVEPKMQTTAEQDMEIIRTKRATSTAGASGATGQPKSKYRKRSESAIRAISGKRLNGDADPTEPEPYAMLADCRKRDKQAGSNGELPPIDMETLRASARAAEVSENKSRSKGRSQQSMEQASPNEPGKPLPQTHHQSSFQLVPIVVAQEPPSTTPVEPNRAPPPPPPQSAMAGAPTSPWPPTSIPPPSNARYAAPDQLQHQSFMRTSQPTDHTPAR